MLRGRPYYRDSNSEHRLNSFMIYLSYNKFGCWKEKLKLVNIWKKKKSRYATKHTSYRYKWKNRIVFHPNTWHTRISSEMKLKYNK